MWPGGAQHLDRVGQVVLALRVLGAQPAQRGREQVAPEAVDRRVDLVDLELLGVGVGVLDDAGDPVVLVADDAAVARSGRRACAVSTVAAASCIRCSVASIAIVSARTQRVVAGQHEDVVFGVEIVERRVERDAHRVAGAALHALLDELDRHLGDELLLERLGDPLGAVADDDHDPLERQLGQRVDDVQHHRAPAQRVQHLRRAGAHARALAGGEHDGGEGSVLAHARAIGSRPRSLVSDSWLARSRWLGGEGSNLD